MWHLLARCFVAKATLPGFALPINYSVFKVSGGQIFILNSGYWKEQLYR